MTVELRVPQVGESITEVQIGDWLKSAGDSVDADEALVVIETDKVTVELPAPSAGKLSKVLKQKGETASVGEVIGYLEDGAAGSAPEGARAKSKTSAAAERQVAPAKGAAAPPPRAEPAPAAQAKTPASAKAPTAQPAEKQAEKQVQKQADKAPDAGQRVMPAARRALAEHGLEAESLSGTGPGGRLQKSDVEDAARAEPEAESEAESEAKPAAEPATRATPARDAGRPEEIVPMTPLRKRVAQRLVEAQRNAAILTTFNEVDMSAVSALRKAQQEAFQARHGVKLGFMSFFVKAAIEALKRVPAVNAEIRGTDIAYRNYYDIGVAVGGGKGLVVPVLRGAERLSFAEVELAIADFAARARDNKLTLEEITGGTFTISNGGIYGSLLSTPILNPPQSGILGLHAIQDRAVVRNGAVVARPMMYVALSYDHRLVDGREAVTFLKHIKECVEEPARILLEL
jgi:2-oxoglutarate dehydrogenase E2 component (dihydrolipoamide succinyltransferase)